MKLYITYTTEDLEEYASQVGLVALEQEWEVIYGPKQGLAQARLESLAGCDALVVLSAFFYGPRLSEGPAIQEQEWDMARRDGKVTGALLIDPPNSVWPPTKMEILSHPQRHPFLEAFKRKLKESGMVEYFNNELASVRSSAQQLLNEFKKELSRKAVIPVFVVWDFTIRGLKHILTRFRDSPPEGHHIEVPGLEGKGAAGEIFRDIVLPGIRKSEKILVITDRPNANVAFEAGLAIGFGKSISLVHFGSAIPSWLQQSVFKGFVVKSIKELKDLRELVKDRDSWYTPPHSGNVPAYGATLFLSPSSYVGAALKEEQRERYPFWKYPPDSFNLNDLHINFSDVTQVVWSIASYSDGTDIRDGLENAANGVISGWFYARTCKTFANEVTKRLHVIREHEAREVVDVEVIEMHPFAQLSEFVERLNKVSDLRLPNPLSSLNKDRFGSINYEMVKVPISTDNYSMEKVQQMWVGICPVTNRHYQAFCNDTKHPEPEYWSHPSIDDDQPVVGVSYKDVEKFCKWVGLGLPTEGQWEYFARAGSTERYWWGEDDSLLSQVAWYKDNSGEQLHPVGTKRPNTWGIHDVFGNVWEWTLKYETLVVYPDYDKEGTEDRAKVCGGSYNTKLKDLDIAEVRLLDKKSLDMGFRCIRIESKPIDNN